MNTHFILLIHQYIVYDDHFRDMLEVSRFSLTLNVYRESPLKPVMVAVNSRVIAG